ncbi:MAG: fused MFS/spermidine synthase, partial [Isosphaeraceae bacterium]
AMLAFLASMVFMALEMVAGRLVTRHLGSSIYGWSSVIAVLLAGLSLGNWLGGKIANYIRNERQASWLFLVASMLTLLVIVLETPAKVHEFATKYLPSVADWIPENSVLMSAPGRTSMTLPGGYEIPLSWPYRILIVVTLVFFLPALSMGTVSPVVAKLAVDRRRRAHSTGTAIGQVYAWGMVGSILGTFLTGFVLIDFLGTKGVILVLVTVLALSATFLGDLVHAVWAGIPLGLCVLAFVPPLWVGNVARFVRFLPPGIDEKSFRDLGERYGIREPEGDPTTRAEAMAYVDESDYYYIKIENEPENGGELQRRTLVLDNLIHGYFMLDHPERLDYDYEHIYALVAYRAAKASGKVKFKPVPAEETTREAREASPAPPAASTPGKGKEPKAEAKPDEKPAVPPPAKPALTPSPAKPEASTPPAKSGNAPKGGTGLRSVAPAPQEGKAKAPAPAPSQAPSDKKTTPAPESKGNEPPANEKKPDASPSPGQEKPGAAEAPKSPVAKQPPLPTEPFKDLKSIFDVKDIPSLLNPEAKKRPEPYLPPVESSNLTTLFLGGGAYCFQRHMLYAYKGTSVDVAEIDPAVTRANQKGTGLADSQHQVANPIPDPANDPASHPEKIVTYWGDARQFVELHQDHKKYDLIFGDAFNDFSVPWHLTTREFNEKIKKMLTPDGVYMINIIDVYLADDQVSARADEEIEDKEKTLRDKIEEKWRIKAARQKLTDEEMERGAEAEIKTVVPLSKEQKDRIQREWKLRARDYGGFVGSWTRTAQLTFGKDNVYIFGTSKPGSGRRETFVVVASMKPLDLKELGLRKDDPRYYTPSGKQTTPKPYEADDLKTVVESRSRGIILTDDYAPVENLLAPVAETRGERE